MLIEIEDETTWPNEVLELFQSNFDVLSKHAIWECSAYKLPHSERWNNPHSGARGYVLYDINELIKDYCVIGYHCTRLLEHEISDIAENGLGLPSRAFLGMRLKKLKEMGCFTLEEVQSLMKQNEYLRQPNREGKVYFVCGISELKDGGQIYKFFRCLGGEAVFNPNESETSLFKKLCTVGIPCIIRVRLRQKPSTDLAQCLEATYLRSRNITTPDKASYVVCLYEPFPKEQILKIITFNDPEFIELTEHHEWDRHITQ